MFQKKSQNNNIIFLWKIPKIPISSWVLVFSFMYLVSVYPTNRTFNQNLIYDSKVQVLCIYIWIFSLILVIYTLFSSSDEGKLYLNPEVVTPWFSFFFTTNLLYNLAWIFVWDREQIVGASIMLFLVAKTNIISLAILARNIAKDGHQLREDKPKIYW